ncbi:MAG: hypothetical protein HFJ11_06995 [Bacilli bacterium]|nr:hypothetical protein [Bacilli bacterium]
MYSIEELANYISLEDIPSSWLNCYEDIKKQYNCNWLDEYDFKLILSYYNFDNKFRKKFEDEIKILKQDNKLNMICFIMYYILFLADSKNYYNIWSWKSTIDVFKNNGSYMIPVVALLCGYQFHIESMKQRNFDDEQIEIQKYNIRLTCTNDSIKYNINGIRFSQMIWGSFFMKGNLIQIGRLQYEVGVKKFDKLDGYFKEKHQYVYIHIPRGENLNEKDVDESFNLADKYIKKYYPELEDQMLAYYTQTWLLSPEVKEILPSDSNIIKFQGKFNIVEYEENINDFLNFVFDMGIGNVKYNDLSDKTILQKKLKKKLLNGDKLHLGLGFLKEE